MTTRTTIATAIDEAPGLEELVGPLAEYVTAAGDRRTVLRSVIEMLVRQTASIEAEAVRFNDSLEN